MKQTITRNMFINQFKEVRPNNFSNKALNILFTYYTELEEDTGEEIELDIIAICCDWSEDDLETILTQYNLENLEELQDHTTVLHVEGNNYLYINY